MRCSKVNVYFVLTNLVWFGVLVLTWTLIIAACSGCNNPHARPWRDDPESIQTEHWMDRHVWTSETEYKQRREWERNNPPKHFLDRMTP